MTNDESGSFGRLVAKVISYLFHPLLLPTLGLWLIFHTDTYLSFVLPLAARIQLYILVFISTFIFPVLSSVLLLSLGKIRSLHMETAEERRLPYLLTVVYFSLGYYMITSRFPLPAQVVLMLLGANVSVAITMLVNMKWKVSAHAIGIGGLTGALLGFSHQLQVSVLNELMLVTLIAGLIGYARLKLDAHNSAQVYVGYLIGFLCEFLLFIFL